MAVVRRQEGRIGMVELAAPPGNALGQGMLEELAAAVDWAEARGLERVILAGQGRGFSAGADPREFGQPPRAPHPGDVLDRIAGGPVPWVAALHGAVLAEGAELALACRYRVAQPGTVIGFPGGPLGLSPGAGATWRLPRLLGVEAALRLLVSGRPVGVEEALRMGLVDALADAPIAQAVALGAGTIRARPSVTRLPAPEPAPRAVAGIRDEVARRMPGEVAPGKDRRTGRVGPVRSAGPPPRGRARGAPRVGQRPPGRRPASPVPCRTRGPGRGWGRGRGVAREGPRRAGRRRTSARAGTGAAPGRAGGGAGRARRRPSGHSRLRACDRNRSRGRGGGAAGPGCGAG